MNVKRMGMMTGKPHPISNVLRTLMASSATSDADLLRRYAMDRDEAAFHVIVRRHGALVLDVCNSVLRNLADAEDAFQATFLTLAIRAGKIHKPAALAAWLHGTAYRIALKARTAAARRRRRETNARPDAELPPIDLSWAEARQSIHEEVNRLPDAERVAIVLCYLMGCSQDETARSLGLSKDGVKKRLERGRKLLRIALSRRGLGACGVLALAAPMMPASKALASSTSDQAIRVVSIGFGEVSRNVLALIDRGTNMFTASKVLISSIAIAATTAVAISVTWNEPGATATAAPRLPDPKNAQAVVKTELDGTWKVVKISDQGKDVGTDDFKGLKFTFKNGKLEINEIPQDKELNWSPQYLHGSKIKVDPDAKLKAIDLRLDPAIDKNATVLGIYQIRKGQLLIAVRTLKTSTSARPAGYSTVSGTLTSFTLELVEENDGVKKP